MMDFSNSLPANNSKQILMVSPAATVATLQGHVILDYNIVVKKGLLKMKAEIEQKFKDDSSLSTEEENFLNSLKIAIEGIIIFSKRLVKKIEETYNLEPDQVKKENLKQVLDNCKHVPLNPAKNFYQAVQSVWTVKTAVELAHPVNLHSFGRMDQIFYPYALQWQFEYIHI
ncbi:MAG: pyruvate formate lyase family protein [Candidatus Helarchaeota archaeon]